MRESDLTVTDAMTRLGTESAFTVMARAQAIEAQGRRVINLGIGQPDFKTPNHIVEAAVQALRDGYHGYTATVGIPELREAVAMDIERRQGVIIDPNNVVVAPGGKPVMNTAITMFAAPGTEILYPDPGFPIYRNLILYAGATPVPVVLKETNGFSFSADDVISKLTDRTRLIILNSPANPTGGVADMGEMDKLANALVDKPHIHILSDEIYGRMVYGGHQHRTMLSYEHLRDRVILLDGWSKTYAMTGWRLGYGIWPSHLLEFAERLAINNHSCVNTAAQYAGIAALNGPQDAVDEMMAAFDSRRILIHELLNALPGVRCIEPAGAFYAFPDISGTGMTSTEAQDRLLDDAGVATIAGSSFGDAGEGYLRISYANSSENIVAAMDQIRQIL